MADNSDVEMNHETAEPVVNNSTEDPSESNAARASDWVRLQSSDGFSYLVRRKVAQTSGTIRTMLDPLGGYAEANSRICAINERGIIVEKLVEYMSFKSHYENVGPKEEIPVRDFLERIPPEIVLELLLAADYQDSKFHTLMLHPLTTDKLW
ncbi:BTB/POZ protein [Crepidotus variabilis]|uniref:Elongin-C n=1 Tax=Crepidotus variabilis TaxID=179855 RepID=A0A9P6ELQ1_9AGAR|nr:BTB/POZ protein [Crepidotus variabilis]